MDVDVWVGVMMMMMVVWMYVFSDVGLRVCFDLMMWKLFKSKGNSLCF